jgi:hypothetical protein
MLFHNVLGENRSFQNFSGHVHIFCCIYCFISTFVQEFIICPIDSQLTGGLRILNNSNHTLKGGECGEFESSIADYEEYLLA